MQMPNVFSLIAGGVRSFADAPVFRIQELPAFVTGECMKMEFIGRNVIAHKTPAMVQIVFIVLTYLQQHFFLLSL